MHACEKSKAVVAEVEAAKLVDLSGEVTIEKSAKNEVTFSGKRNLAFGVELHELQYNSKTNKMTLKMPPPHYIPARGGQSLSEYPPDFIGGLDDEVFLTVACMQEKLIG